MFTVIGSHVLGPGPARFGRYCPVVDDALCDVCIPSRPQRDLITIYVSHRDDSLDVALQLNAGDVTSIEPVRDEACLAANYPIPFTQKSCEQLTQADLRFTTYINDNVGFLRIYPGRPGQQSVLKMRVNGDYVERKVTVI